jgi:hypothetical protein
MVSLEENVSLDHLPLGPCRGGGWGGIRKTWECLINITKYTRSQDCSHSVISSRPGGRGFFSDKSNNGDKGVTLRWLLFPFVNLRPSVRRVLPHVITLAIYQRNTIYVTPVFWILTVFLTRPFFDLS